MITKKGFVWTVAFCLYFVALALPKVALADDDTEQLYSYIKAFYDNLLLPLGTILAGFVIMYGGISYAMSAGDPAKVQRAKEYIYGAISGLVLLICAALIVKTIA